VHTAHEKMKTVVSQKASFTEGPLLKKMILFAIPIIISGVLQQFYNSADSIIVGKFSGDENALGAVGSTSAVFSLIVHLIMGLGTGTSVLIAQFMGAKDEKSISKTVHTSVLTGLVGGIIVMLIGEMLAAPMLTLLGTKAELYDLALLYLRIVFIGVPGNAIFNFAALSVRAAGDSKTPMLIPATTGIVNVLLNLLFVVAFDMSVAGVALATVISQYLSGIMSVIILIKRKDAIHFSFGKLEIDLSILKKILIIGIPSGIQTSLGAISNMVLQSAVNTLPAASVSGVAIGTQIEGYLFLITSAVYATAVTFIGQNYGAKRLDRTKRVLATALLEIAVICAVVSTAILLFSGSIASLFVDSSAANRDAVIVAARERIRITTALYFLSGIAEMLTAFLRGYGRSTIPMLSSVFFNVVLRIIWAKSVFPHFGTITGLYLIYPISWAAAIALLTLMSVFVYRKTKRQIAEASDT